MRDEETASERERDLPKGTPPGQLSPGGAQAGGEVTDDTNGHNTMLEITTMTAQLDIGNQSRERPAIKIRKLKIAPDTLTWKTGRMVRSLTEVGKLGKVLSLGQIIANTRRALPMYVLPKALL